MLAKVIAGVLALGVGLGAGCHDRDDDDRDRDEIAADNTGVNERDRAEGAPTAGTADVDQSDVSIMAKMAPPTTSGNQPPCSILMALAPMNTSSGARKIADTAAALGMPQPHT